MNIHIAAALILNRSFSPQEAGYPNCCAAVLYDCSGPMPEVFNEAIREARGPEPLPRSGACELQRLAEQLITCSTSAPSACKTDHDTGLHTFIQALQTPEISFTTLTDAVP